MQKPIKIAVYSRQPFVLRQLRDVQEKMGSDYIVFGVGDKLTAGKFQRQNPKSINVCLGEVARLININYTQNMLKQFQVDLTRDEMDELKSLIHYCQQRDKKTLPQVSDNTSTVFAAPRAIPLAAPEEQPKNQVSEGRRI